MAILTEIPGIQVVVKVDGKDATEYPSPDPQHRQAICPTSCVYIESVDDARFAVELVVDESYDFARDEEHHLLIRVEIDGGILEEALANIPPTPPPPPAIAVGQNTGSLRHGSASSSDRRSTAPEMPDTGRH
ncbi:hypothetical protein PG991_010446 [Apiospora marii]|uniref:DUF7918 domain-containing protein n=1 Tax=Apiospora marii TaxID=335849 RepID=A0ABR1RJL1_9PEZI